MKKLLLSAFLVSMIAGVNAQCYKYVVFEHFTQASCGPCAAQNPSFQNNVLTPNPNTVRHIAYHTSWPGTDHMYTNNTTDNGAKPSFYGVTGVPFMVMDGNVKTGGPTSFSQLDVDSENAKGSPLKINVTDVGTGTHTVTIDVMTVGTMPTGSYNLVAAIVERSRTYTSAPGSNGEKYFPNVFLDMLTTGTNGQAITLAPQGQKTTVTFNYSDTQPTLSTLTNPSVNLSNLAIVAFVQDNSNKNILQAGSTYDLPINATVFQPSQIVKDGTNGAASTFTFQVGNGSSSSEQFTYTLTSTGAPSGWASDFTVNGTNYTTTGTVTVPANTNYPATINVTPDASPGVGKYTLTVTSVTNPTSPAMKLSVYVISGVTDLIVNGTGGFGDASITGTTANFEGEFVAGLQYAGNTKYAVTDATVLENAIKDNAMGGVKNIYLNIGWTFPSLTEGLVAQLTTFLNTAGKCMFICGQDIGWEIMTPANNTPAAITSFFTNYMNATFSSDGTTANTQLTNNTSDAVFGAIGNHNISATVPYTSSFYFPDELGATGNGQVIFNYNSTAKVAGVRATNGTYKVVYLGIGIEQLATASSKNEILKLSHDWFYGLTSTLEFDQQMLAQSLGQNYPNPSASVTYVPMNNLKKDVVLQVTDLAGRVVLSQQVVAGTGIVVLNTENLESGLYMYSLVDNEKIITTKPMQVVH